MKRRCNVLVVDEQRSACELISAMLSDQVARVHLACDASHGLEFLKAEPIDVLFADMRIPESDGVDLIRSSLQLRPQVGTVVLAGCGTLESAVEAMRRGACDYVVKPFDRQTILAALDRALLYKRFWQSVDSGPDGTSSYPRLSEVKIAAASPQMRDILHSAERLAQTPFPILLEGETGVGKQLLARRIHCHGGRADGPFIHFTCSALQDARPGGEHPDWRRFILSPAPTEVRGPRLRTGSTFYAEHVTELPRWAQRQLLQRIEGSWLPSTETADGDGSRVRIIVSADASLDAAVLKGEFCRGLYDLLHPATLSIPPLRKRPDDIRALVHHFLECLCPLRNRDAGVYRRMISEELWASLFGYGWPGNVRELASLLASALLIKDGKDFEQVLRRHTSIPGPVPHCETVSVPVVSDLRTIERYVVREVVRRHGGNKAAAARALGMHRRTLYRVLENGKSGSPTPAEISAVGVRG